MILLSRIFQFFRRAGDCVTDKNGFSLIEILVATALFLVVSTGVASTMVLGLRSTVHTRMATLGKTAVQQQIEEMRSRDYYVPYSTDPDVGTTADIDLLDRYYPDMNTSHTIDGQSWEGWYTNSGDDAYYTMQSSEDIHGIIVTVETRFKDSFGETIIPTSGYDSNSSADDSPSSDLVEVKVTANWLNRNTENSYTNITNIASTDKAETGGSEDAGGEAGCINSSNSTINITGGSVKVSTLDSPFEDFIYGTLGSADASVSYDCISSTLAHGMGGKWGTYDDVYYWGGDEYPGAETTVSGPPSDTDYAGPLSVGPTGSWPSFYIGQSEAKVAVDNDDDIGEISSKAQALYNDLNIHLWRVSEDPCDCPEEGYIRWDFVNPALSVEGASSIPYDYDGDSFDENALAEIVQEDGVSIADGEVDMGQVNFVPLEAITDDIPSAEQGLVFIRDFRAESHSEASQSEGSASNTLTYSATIGMYNLSKDSDCSGDGCYDLYQISPDNPLQTTIDLDNPDYKLQQALITEWESYTTTDINDVMNTSDDGSTATINVDALIKIIGNLGSEVRMQSDSPGDVTLMDANGTEQLWLGIFDVSLVQNE